jgi:hypothetical protein
MRSYSAGDAGFRASNVDVPQCAIARQHRDVRARLVNRRMKRTAVGSTDDAARLDCRSIRAGRSHISLEIWISGIKHEVVSMSATDRKRAGQRSLQPQRFRRLRLTDGVREEATSAGSCSKRRPWGYCYVRSRRGLPRDLVRLEHHSRSSSSRCSSGCSDSAPVTGNSPRATDSGHPEERGAP